MQNGPTNTNINFTAGTTVFGTRSLRAAAVCGVIGKSSASRTRMQQSHVITLTRNQERDNTRTTTHDKTDVAGDQSPPHQHRPSAFEVDQDLSDKRKKGQTKLEEPTKQGLITFAKTPLATTVVSSARNITGISRRKVVSSKPRQNTNPRTRAIGNHGPIQSSMIAHQHQSSTGHFMGRSAN